MPKTDYFANSYSIQIENLVRLLIRMKLNTSKILNNLEKVLENYEESYDIKIRELEQKNKTAIIELEDSVNKIIALSHPVAFDLRFLLSSIKISSEIHYISSWARKTVSAVQRISKENINQNTKKDLLEMLRISIFTLKDVISTLLNFDSKKKADNEILFKLDILLEKDNLVDEIYRKVLQHELSSIKENNINPLDVFEIIGMAKNFEKISDCINNMIITTRYVLTGKRV